ncbi:MAG: anthranilate synthase component II, partial [Candidatus Cryptobacteroides sp.]
MKTAIIDNYDSFTYNLVHLVRELGSEVSVYRNDCFAMEDLQDADRILLSPGPGIPSEAGKLMDVINEYSGVKPILGICLGEQAIGEYFGGTLVNLEEVFHGVQTTVHVVADDGIFKGLDKDFPVGR